MNGTFLNKIVSLLYSSCNIEYFRQIIKHSHVIPFYLTFHYVLEYFWIIFPHTEPCRTARAAACMQRWLGPLTECGGGDTRRFLSRECEAEFGDIVAVLGGGMVCHLANIIVVGILNQWRHRFPEIRSIYWEECTADRGIMAACQTRIPLLP